MNTTLTSRLASAESACRRLAESTKDIHVSFEAANNEAEKLKGVLLQTQIYLDEKETEFLEVMILSSFCKNTSLLEIHQYFEFHQFFVF